MTFCEAQFKLQSTYTHPRSVCTDRDLKLCKMQSAGSISVII